MTQALNVLIVGCGNIAGGFDQAREDHSPPQTHAGAFSADQRFTVQACIEPDAEKREAFADFWNIPQRYADFDEINKDELELDIVSVCSPTDLHKAHIEAALTLSPKVIFCEKPLTPSMADSQSIVELCAKSGTALCINHNRRWDPKISELRQAIEQQTFGSLRSVVGYYNKGVLNNGSHLIDLIQFLIGDLTVLATGGIEFDYLESDPSISALLRSSTGIPVHLVTGHANDYSLFQLQLIFAERLITMEAGGQTWFIQELINNPLFSGYKLLDQGKRYQGSYAATTVNAIDNIYTHLSQGTTLASDGWSALSAQNICEQIYMMQTQPQQAFPQNHCQKQDTL